MNTGIRTVCIVGDFGHYRVYWYGNKWMALDENGVVACYCYPFTEVTRDIDPDDIDNLLKAQELDNYIRDKVTSEEDGLDREVDDIDNPVGRMMAISWGWPIVRHARPVTHDERMLRYGQPMYDFLDSNGPLNRLNTVVCKEEDLQERGYLKVATYHKKEHAHIINQQAAQLTMDGYAVILRNDKLSGDDSDNGYAVILRNDQLSGDDSEDSVSIWCRQIVNPIEELKKYKLDIEPNEIVFPKMPRIKPKDV